MFVKRGLKDVKEVCLPNPLEGRGNLHIRQLLGDNEGLRGLVEGNPDDLESCIHFFADMVMDAGSLVGLHPHTDSEEIYYILSGKARMAVDGVSFELNEGEAINTKAGSEHSIENIGDTPLRFIAVEGSVVIKQVHSL